MNDNNTAVATCSYIACISMQNIIEIFKLAIRKPTDGLSLLRFQLITEMKEFFEERNYEKDKEEQQKKEELLKKYKNMDKEQ